MANLEKNSKKGFVDPYYNDLCGYKQTINVITIENDQYQEISIRKRQSDE